MKIVTDCAADMTAEELGELGITQAPLFIQFPEGEVNSADISADDFYNRLEALRPQIPTTAQPSSGIFAELYRKLAQMDKDILSVHISSGLSGTINSANPVFLVGAAWLPLAAISIDRSLRLEKPGWAVVFGLTLTLQLLGGDPETAYLAVVAALLYAVVLDRRWAPWIGLALVSFQAVRHRAAPGALSLDVTLAIVCVVVGLALARRGGPSPKSRLASFATACGLVLALGAVQWLPTAEFVRLSARALSEREALLYAAKRPRGVDLAFAMLIVMLDRTLLSGTCPSSHIAGTPM